jgi:hypothetical protein
MSGSEAPVIAFDVKGDPAMAWYFVMAHWPDRSTQPAIRIDLGTTIQILVPATPECLGILRTTIDRSRDLPEMRHSADALVAELKRRVLPEFDPGSHRSTG